MAGTQPMMHTRLFSPSAVEITPTTELPTQPAIPQSRGSQRPAGDAEMPPLATLGTEILGIVMELIRRESPETLSSVALVSSHLHHVARYSQFRSVTFDLGRPARKTKPKNQDLSSCARYMENAHLEQAVRSLTILGWKVVPEEWAQLSALVPKLTGLSEINWYHTGPVPDDIIQDLQRRPCVSLNIRFSSQTFQRGHSSLDRCPLEALECCPNLRSLEITHTLGNAESCLWVTRPLRRVLLSCPNLRRLKLDIGMRRGGCCISFPPSEYCGIGFTHGERPLAALEELDLVRYPFGVPELGTGGNGLGALARFYSIGYPLQVPEKNYWVEAFDWSRLRTLNLVEHSPLALDLLPRLTSLREVALMGGPPESLRAFHQAAPPGLEAVAISRLADVELGSILKHGRSLRKLRIHQNENWEDEGPTWADEAMSIQALQAIRETCPFIEELGLDLSRDGTWPYEALDILASFPRLRRLEIWFELGIRDQQNPVRPYTTFHASQEIYRYLLERSPTRPPRLAEVRIHSGAPPPLGFGYPGAAALWPGRNHADFVCKFMGRDDAAYSFSTTCSQAYPIDNQFLQMTKPGAKKEELKSQYESYLRDRGIDSRGIDSRGHKLYTAFLPYYGPTPGS